MSLINDPIVIFGVAIVALMAIAIAAGVGFANDDRAKGEAA